RRPLIDGEKRLLWLSFALIASLMMLVPNMVTSQTVEDSSLGITAAILPPETYWVGMAAALVGIVLMVIADRRVAARTGSGLDPRARLLWLANFVWFVVPNLRVPGLPSL